MAFAVSTTKHIDKDCFSFLLFSVQEFSIILLIFVNFMVNKYVFSKVVYFASFKNDVDSQ